jgi:hypothetical protein
MSHRRGGNQKESVIAVEEEAIPFSESMDQPIGGLAMDRNVGDVEDPKVPLTSGSLSLDARYDEESRELRSKEWKEGHFAAGMTPPTWREEFQKWKNNPRAQCTNCDDSDGAPCLCCSAILCGMINAGRVGNMSVLRQSQEWVEEEQDDENGEMKILRYTRPRIDCVVGPYWPMLLMVTYPLILGVSIATLIHAIPGKPAIVALIWGACTLGLIYSLALTAFRDPGILPRQLDAPDGNWRWSDRAHSYRPPGAWFDPDTGVIVEEFDHT